MDIRELETADYDILENIKTAFYRLWKQKIIVVIMTLVGVMAAFIYIGLVGIQTYYSTGASIYSAAYGSYEDSADGVAIMNTHASLLNSNRVCERAAALLQDYNVSAAALKSMVNSGRIYLSGASSNSKSYGYKLTLVVVSTSSEYIVDVANAMAKAFVDEINDVMGTGSLQVMDEAVSYGSYKSLNPMLYILLFAAAAGVMTAGIIFIKEFLSAYVYSVAQCEQNKDLILGILPYDK